MSKAVPILRVADAAVSAEWYARLGFVVEFEHRFEPELPAYVGIVRDDASIHLSEHTGDASGPGLVYLWVDAVARGESESVLVPLIEALASGDDLSSIPNLCYRGPEGAVIESEATGAPVDMDSLPTPDYFEYFERLEACPRVQSAVEVQLPVTLSKGCWWGAKKKNHCTFCGLNGIDMASRVMSDGRAFRTLVELSSRHQCNDFTATDNILPLSYFDNLLPRLAEESFDLAIFYEVKANMTRSQVALLRSAGVRTIQPGIESLSSSVLRFTIRW